MQGLARFAKGQGLLQCRLYAVISAELGPASLLSRRLEHAAASSSEGAGPWAQEDGGVPAAAAAAPAAGAHSQGEAADPDLALPDDSRRRQQRQASLWPVSVTNVSRSLTRQDLVDFFPGCNLTLEEVRCV
jgi:hypothetical protein